jgi:hypothetical protein
MLKIELNRILLGTAPYVLRFIELKPIVYKNKKNLRYLNLEKDRLMLKIF